jgi:hypothetical protein
MADGSGIVCQWTAATIAEKRHADAINPVHHAV